MEDKTFEQYLDEAFDELEEAERELDLELLDEDISEEFCFERTSRDTAILSLYEGDEETVVVPGQIGGFRVTAIADGAFFMRDKLQTLILPDSVETIRDFALQECRALRRLVLPRNLRSLGKMAISGSPLLEKVELPAECEKYVLREGILFSADGTSLLLCPPAGGLCEYAVPEGVRRAGQLCFQQLQASAPHFAGREPVAHQRRLPCRLLRTEADRPASPQSCPAAGGWLPAG